MPTLVSGRCQPHEISADYHRGLIEATPGNDVLEVLQDQRAWLQEVAAAVHPDQVDQIHAPYGWTIRQVFAHCADAERVFGYRMLRFAAGDATELPGWDEDFYADSRFGLGALEHLVSELEHLRQANLLLLQRIEPRCWDRSGVAEGKRLSVRALAWLAAGHLRHHGLIVQKRLEQARPHRN